MFQQWAHGARGRRVGKHHRVPTLRRRVEVVAEYPLTTPPKLVDVPSRSMRQINLEFQSDLHWIRDGSTACISRGCRRTCRKGTRERKTLRTTLRVEKRFHHYRGADASSNMPAPLWRPKNWGRGPNIHDAQSIVSHILHFEGNFRPMANPT